MRGPSLAAALAAAAVLAGATVAGAGSLEAQSPVDASPHPTWRFPVGERFTYDVMLGPVRVGKGELEVEAIERVDGVPTYRVSHEMSGGPFFYKIDDRQVSWIAPDPIRSLAFEERLRQGDYTRDRRYRLDQETDRYTRFELDSETGEFEPVESYTDVPMPEDALDDISYLYLARTLPLEVGETYRFDRYFEEDGNPMHLEVLRRERVRVPAGRFETIVVRPVIRTSGLFSEGGEAEVYLTDDERRIIVQLETRSKAGRVNLYLREYEPGSPEGFIGTGDDGAPREPPASAPKGTRP